MELTHRLEEKNFKWESKGLRILTSASRGGQRPLVTGCGLLTQGGAALQAVHVQQLHMLGMALLHTGNANCTLDARMAAAEGAFWQDIANLRTPICRGGKEAPALRRAHSG